MHYIMNKEIFMKKIIFLIVTTFLVIGLVACSNTSFTAGSADNPAVNGKKTMTIAEEFLVGTLKLEGTALAVDKTQALTLLTLWQAYRELQSNNSAATEEITAIVSQIQSTMTSEQLKAIDDLKLTSQDVADTMSSLGIGMANENGSGTQTAPSGQEFVMGIQGDPGGSGAPAGGPPAGGGGPQIMGGSSSGTVKLSQSQLTTMQASNGTGNNTPGGTTALIDALIKILEKRAQG
jgi:hypothetical protein